MLNDETKVIKLSQVKDETNVIDMSNYMKANNNNDKWISLCKHGRTMVMMYQATGEVSYLVRARADLANAKSIKECSFVRPLGILLTA